MAHDVIVVGGGQAGLAIGYHLKQQGLSFVILEAAEEPAAAWRQRWDSLRLFTPVRYNSLPGWSFQGDPDSYPGRDDVVAYLTEYASRFELPVVLGCRVRAVRAEGDSYVIEAGDRTYGAAQVVIATGPFQTPRVPAFARALAQEVTQLHSNEYQSPRSVGDGPVLVVGGGNTGFQIAAELAASQDVHLAIGSRQLPLPQRFLGRDLFTWLEAAGVMRKTVDSRLGRRMKDRDTLIGSRPRRLRRRYGVELHGRVTSASGSEVTFADGERLTVDSVIWATGFELDHSWIEMPISDDSGRVAHRRGVTASPGLYFFGLPWQHTRGSALLGWVKDDAQYLEKQIAAFHAKTRRAVPALDTSLSAAAAQPAR